MKKSILNVSLIAGLLLSARESKAQTAASIPQTPLPTITGTGNPVVKPQNAASSTFQNISFGGVTNNLYVHSWDNPDWPDGIAWRRSDNTGATLNQGYLTIPYANDIDIVIYESAGNYYVLAAYYFNNGTAATKGHYYDIYKFTATGLAVSSTMNLLALSPTFGRINVDATASIGLSIIWRGTNGIYVKAAALPAALFGPNVLLPGTVNFKDPDVCINYYPSKVLQMVYLSNTNNNIIE